MIAVPCNITYNYMLSQLLSYHGVRICFWVNQNVFHHVIALVDVVADGVFDPVL
jgi:hypothetical protein